MITYEMRKGNSQKATISSLEEWNNMNDSLLLRDVAESDLPIFFEQQRDPEAASMADFPSREREPFMEHWTKILADKNVVVRTILFNGQVAGNILSFEVNGKREVGYWLGREFWGYGIATRALAKFLEFVTERPLYGYVAKKHLASQRVLAKCGFKPFGSATEFSQLKNAEVEYIIFTLE